MHLSVGVKFPATLPHHPYRNSYKGHYDDLELSGCVAYCGKCHFSLHKGRKLCPICKEKYPLWDQEMCTGCYNKAHPEMVEAKKVKVEEKKALLKKLRDAEKAKAKEWKKRNSGGWT